MLLNDLIISSITEGSFEASFDEGLWIAEFLCLLIILAEIFLIFVQIEQEDPIQASHLQNVVKFFHFRLGQCAEPTRHDQGTHVAGVEHDRMRLLAVVFTEVND